MFDFPKQVTILVPNHRDSVRLTEFLNSETEVTWGSGDRPSADKHHRDYISPSAKTAVRIYDGRLMWRGNIDLYTSDPKYMGDPEWHLLSVDEFISKITGIPDSYVSYFKRDKAPRYSLGALMTTKLRLTNSAMESCA